MVGPAAGIPKHGVYSIVVRAILSSSMLLEICLFRLSLLALSLLVALASRERE